MTPSPAAISQSTEQLLLQHARRSGSSHTVYGEPIIFKHPKREMSDGFSQSCRYLQSADGERDGELQADPVTEADQAHVGEESRASCS